MKIPKAIRDHLLDQHHNQCVICGEAYPQQFLQIDHRIPYAIIGDIPDPTPTDYLLLCRACNRAKSWTCEHCPNFQTQDPTLCLSCYWANPRAYQHIATRALRRVELVWTEDDAAIFDALYYKADIAGVALHSYLKAILERFLTDETE